ncbi:MAG: UDP-N-acetylglucosamine 2-epimerase (non-hydrolyzing) [Chloroflexi bacterium]|nr:MAG: UDP-N-acetylglucosamine 2-epimerase (non-hydrolyzing) [Chloroflexota bacterium]MBL1193149.1 UDP-N-acetylglucosamine 2-epimerase (non-hydrolyzing) [Chloroflexota bacterium]NOH10442.1 UDP-N-acetylglucosamine 2-epimerase (non-hydrolyzing) [Chloroflexota bacterium]
MKVVTVVGARPQFIKLAPVSKALRVADGIKETLVHTGQHYDKGLSEVFFEELDIRSPNYHLDIGSSSHAQQTGKMMIALERILETEKPDWVLVYGDTNSTLAGALAASKLNIRVAHVEAGLRSYNRRMPEELNRILTDHASDLLFSPTKVAQGNLIAEGISKSKAIKVGDVMYDATLLFREKAEKHSRILERLKLTSNDYILATAHRAENTDNVERLQAIFESLKMIGEKHQVVFPVHPRTEKVLEQHFGVIRSDSYKSLQLIAPVGYLDMLKLIGNAGLVLTDSGGIQKEAYFLKTLCITLRDETEWVELVDTGWNRIVPPRSTQDIVTAVEMVMGVAFKELTYPALYGDGKAAQKIANAFTGQEPAVGG